MSLAYAHYTVEVVVKQLERFNRTSRDVVLNVSSRYRLGLVALTSRSRLGLDIIRLVYNPEVNHLSIWRATYRSTQPSTLRGMVK